MNNSTPGRHSPRHRHEQGDSSARSRKIKALLAGGTVMGFGAVMTLAAWTDQVWAGAEFSAGVFNVETSPTGAEGSYREHPTQNDALELEFEVRAANLSPGDSVAAPLVLRLDADTTYAATVVLESVSPSGSNAPHLSYSIVRVPTASACAPNATGQSVGSGATLAAVSNPVPFSLTPGAGSAAGDPVALCFRVTAGSGLLQGQGATGQWRFVATSVESGP